MEGFVEWLKVVHTGEEKISRTQRIQRVDMPALEVKGHERWLVFLPYM